MTLRVREVLDYIDQHRLHPFSAFGPVRRGSIRPFIGGGVVTLDEFRAVMAALFPPQNLDAYARNRLYAAAARAENGN